MTKDEAIEKCTKAMLKTRGIGGQNWREQSKDVEFASKLVPALEALGLLKTSP